MESWGAQKEGVYVVGDGMAMSRVACPFVSDNRAIGAGSDVAMSRIVCPDVFAVAAIAGRGRGADAEGDDYVLDRVVEIFNQRRGGFLMIFNKLLEKTALACCAEANEKWGVDVLVSPGIIVGQSKDVVKVKMFLYEKTWEAFRNLMYDWLCEWGIEALYGGKIDEDRIHDCARYIEREVIGGSAAEG